MENERLTMSIPEFAKAAGISRNQAYMLASTGSLGIEVLHFGRRMVIPRKAALRFLSGGGSSESLEAI